MAKRRYMQILRCLKAALPWVLQPNKNQKGQNSPNKVVQPRRSAFNISFCFLAVYSAIRRSQKPLPSYILPLLNKKVNGKKKIGSKKVIIFPPDFLVNFHKSAHFAPRDGLKSRPFAIILARAAPALPLFYQGEKFQRSRFP